MSIFSETMIKAISEYRFLLRRHLSQIERMSKLQQLNLRDDTIYNSDLALYETGIKIIRDIENNMVAHHGGYYSYSGIKQFAAYLTEYLSNYYVENNTVVHRAQKASRALLRAIQLMALPREQLNDQVVQQLCDYNEIIVHFGSKEQCDLQLQNILRQKTENPALYSRVSAHLESLLNSRDSLAA